MSEIILQVFMLIGAGIAGYGVRALQHPVQKRAKNGRFTKG